MTQSRMVGNNSVNHFSISISNFVLIKAFDVKIRPTEAPNIKKVLWIPPSRGRMKCNCDEAFNSESNDSGCEGTFRNEKWEVSLSAYLL